MYTVKCLNPIASKGLDLFTEDFKVIDDLDKADAVLVRSAAMHDLAVPESLLAVARAGAGVNNIPLDEYAKKGIVAFNTPGANANGVKELVVAGLLLASRDIIGGYNWVKENASEENLAKLVEKQKKQYAGNELKGKSIGVIGLGAIGVLVANICNRLGMKVYGYDPYVSVRSAWSLSRMVKHIASIDELFETCDYITIHVPYMDSTKGMINKEAIDKMKDGVTLLNFARGELVDNQAVIEGLASGKVKHYVTDFPSAEIAGVDKVITIPHLGASTEESEENCAEMAVDQLMNYLENGNIVNSVNYPNCDMGTCVAVGRISLAHSNTPNMISQVTKILGSEGLNIADMTNKSKGDPVSKMPSYTAMKELVRSDKTVMAKLDKERQESAQDYFSALGQSDDNADSSVDDSDDESWREDLEKNPNTAKNEKTIANIVLILSNDKNFKGKIWLDDFAGRLMVTCPLPWDSGDGSREWKDSDDAQLALRLEREYQITGKDKIENAVKVVSDNNKRNEVKDLIQSFRWDGVQRIPTLLHDYLGAEQSVYTADIMKKSLAAAVARAFSDGGVKYDYMVIFTGKQGIGKSTFLSKLGMDWFSDSLYNFEGKEAAELIQGTLINEVGELSAMNKSETEAIKQFLSKTHDIYRAAYGRHTFKRPRRCVFFGSTNSDAFLKDATGNRRFWPIKVGVVPTTKNIFTDLDNEVSQIWAEAYVYYMLGEPLYLDGESKEMSEKLQEDFREIDPWQIEIEEFLAKKIPPNWYSLKLQEQKSWWNGNFGCENKDRGFNRPNRTR